MRGRAKSSSSSPGERHTPGLLGTTRSICTIEPVSRAGVKGSNLLPSIQHENGIPSQSNLAVVSVKSVFGASIVEEET